MSISRPFEIALFVFFCALTLWLAKPSADQPYKFDGDDLRYMRYAVALHQHGVFGLSGEDVSKAPDPGNANAPFYPALLAGIMSADQNFTQSVLCIQEKGPNAGCPENFEAAFIVQIALSVLCLYLIYLLAHRLSRNRSMGWIAALLALASGIFQEFSFVFLTEILILPAFTALLLFCLKFYQHGAIRWVVAIGFCLAALTLIRPSYLYLFYGFILFFAAVWAVKRERRIALQLGVLIFTFIVAVVPWAMRNKAHFDSYALTSGGYAEAILIQRTNYNQMSWPEVGVAMIYWLPDFGDSLARKIFPEALHDRLGWNEGSYYSQGYAEQIEKLSEELGDHDQIFEHLIHEEFLTLKHVAVSIPLALRGTFIAKYWGLIGFIAFLILAFNTARHRDYRLLVIAAPLFFMVTFHAGISVSIPRYNLPLIALYALCIAWYINLYGTRLVQKIRHQ